MEIGLHPCPSLLAYTYLCSFVGAQFFHGKIPLAMRDHVGGDDTLYSTCMDFVMRVVTYDWPLTNMQGTQVITLTICVTLGYKTRLDS
jgi:hypothetical protein